MTAEIGRTYNIGLLQCWRTNMSSSFYLCSALVPADGILLNNCLKHQHLFINWASVPAGQAMKASTAASPNVICHSSTKLNSIKLFRVCCIKFDRNFFTNLNCNYKDKNLELVRIRIIWNLLSN